MLIVLGALFFISKQSPDINRWVEPFMQWPLNIVGVGALILLIGLLLGAPGMAVPAAIVAGIGGILYYQTKTEDPQYWAYMWTLIPGFVGVGMLVSGLLSRSMSQARSGLNQMAVSAVLFIAFAAFFGKLGLLGPYGPAILLVALGVWLLISNFLHKK
jgi:peptidoglycan/LPS O-acetylase OafA/YrhL